MKHDTAAKMINEGITNSAVDCTFTGIFGTVSDFSVAMSVTVCGGDVAQMSAIVYDGSLLIYRSRLVSYYYYSSSLVQL